LLDHSNSGTISTAGEYARFSRFTVELSCPDIPDASLEPILLNMMRGVYDELSLPQFERALMAQPLAWESFETAR